MKTVRTHHDLDLWQVSMAFAVEIYRVTDAFPVREKYGIISQMRRAAISIPSNIAEGASRTSAKEFRYFIAVALGSATELETQMELACRLGFANTVDQEIKTLFRIRSMLIHLRKALDLKIKNQKKERSKV